MNKGILTISFDTELIWGRVHLSNYDQFISRAEKVHKTIPRLLTMLDTYQIPVTWAVVGHIFLDRCNSHHSDIKRPDYKNMNRDWFAEDPGSDEKKAPAWYGKSILKKIQKYGYHDIGSHTFSHFYWGEEGCTKECAESDLKAWVALASKANIDAKSFVFPKNSVNHLSLLPKYGFKIYRGPDKNWYDSTPSYIHTLLQAVDLFLPIAPKTNTLRKIDKLFVTTGSLYFPSGRGIRSKIPIGVRSTKAKRGIDSAINNREIFHLWTHPIDFSEDTEKLLHDFEDILKYAAEKREAGKIEIKTMKELTKKVI